MDELDYKHKKDFAEFVRARDDNAKRIFEARLYEKWAEFNHQYFGGQMFIEPYILLANPTSNKALGAYNEISSFGGSSEILVRPTVFDRTFPGVRSFMDSDGIDRFCFDILLHYTVRQYMNEIRHEPEPGYDNYGPAFAGECNRISKIMGYEQSVRKKPKRGKDKHLPSCVKWPFCVRPPGYYGDMSDEPPKKTASSSSNEGGQAKLGVEQILNLANKNLSVPDKDVLGFKLLSDAFMEKLNGLKREKGTASGDNRELPTLAQIQGVYEHLMAT